MAVNKTDWSFGWHGHRAGLALYYFDDVVMQNDHHELSLTSGLTLHPQLMITKHNPLRERKSIHNPLRERKSLKEVHIPSVHRFNRSLTTAQIQNIKQILKRNCIRRHGRFVKKFC